MKEQFKLYKKILLIIIPVLFLILFFEVKARELESGFSLKKKIIERNAAEINTLILGSSHGYLSINPDVLGHGSRNLANYSQDLYYDDMIFSKYKNELKNLKCILLSVSYFSLWYDVNCAPENWRKYFYKRTFDIPSKSPYSFSDLTDIKTYSLAFFYRLENVLYGMISPRLFSFGTKMNSSGWNIDTLNTFVDSSEISLNKGKDRVDFTNTLIVRDNFEYNVNILDKFSKYAKENNIKLVFVTMPVSYIYSEYMNKNVYDEFTGKVSEFTDNNNIIYLNYFNDKRFSLKDYYDYDHLNGSGSLKFSNILKDTLETLKVYGDK